MMHVSRQARRGVGDIMTTSSVRSYRPIRQNLCNFPELRREIRAVQALLLMQWLMVVL